MNEKLWLTCRDGGAMLDWLASRPRPLVPDHRLRLLCLHLLPALADLYPSEPDYPRRPLVWLRGWSHAAADVNDADGLALVAGLLRCVAGNLFVPVSAHGCLHCNEPAPVSGDPCRWCGLEVTPSALFTWEGGRVVAFARSVLESGQWPMLGALADLVEEAGVENAALTEHLRGPGCTVKAAGRSTSC